MLFRRVVTSRALVCAVALSAGSAGFAQQPSAGDGAQLQHRAPVAQRVGQAAPPEPLVAPTTTETPKAANGNVIYMALRQRTPSGASFRVQDVTLRRDVGELRLKDGTVTLYNEVNGRVTGAVFTGQGVLHLEPPNAMERRQAKLMMKTEVLDEPFSTAVLAFTDDTAKELQKSSAGAVTGVNAMGPAVEMQSLFRKDLKYNLEARLLEDVAGSRVGGFFLADLKGPIYSKRLLYVVDPHGALGVSPEDVGLLTSANGTYDVTLGFMSEPQRRAGVRSQPEAVAIRQQTITTDIAKNGALKGKATALVQANVDGVLVLPLELFPTLRVSGVWGPKGEALEFVQEDKERDADFAVVLQHPLAKGETIAITTQYAGRDVVDDLGSGNYAVNGGARESWYPNVRGTLGNYAHYRLIFHTGKDTEVIATGNRLRDVPEGKDRTSEWQTTSPIPVAGFNLGTFKSNRSERKADFAVASYANAETSDNITAMSESGRILGGTMTTTGMLKRATSEGDAAVQVYTDYFGPLPFDHVALTQQSACTYGQSWPMLVYLPVCYFWDSMIQHQLGVLDGDPTYWKVVTAHEVAHQWWGQTVGFGSYRDQWMSEGFADFSASLFLMETSKDMKPYHDFWDLERKRLLEKNANGMRPVDVGPVVMGTRLSSSRAGGGVYQALIYPKGAYILHMLEMLYWSPQYKEAPFKQAMHDFVRDYNGKVATTEDFKAAMEKDMPAWANAAGDKRLDWFFNEWVYGTDVPTYVLTSSFEAQGESVTAHMSLAQKGVSDDFLMMVPLYLELEDKHVIMVGHVRLKGNETVDKTFNMGKLPGKPRRLLVNYNNDVLSAN